MVYKDKELERLQERRYYEKNKAVLSSKNKLYMQRRKYEKKRALLQMFGNKCMKCGASHPAILQFHHASKDKEMNIGVMLSKQFVFEKIVLEAKKYILICANCHFILHYKEPLSDLEMWEKIRKLKLKRVIPLVDKKEQTCPTCKNIFYLTDGAIKWKKRRGVKNTYCSKYCAGVGVHRKDPSYLLYEKIVKKEIKNGLSACAIAKKYNLTKQTTVKHMKRLGG